MGPRPWSDNALDKLRHDGVMDTRGFIGHVLEINDFLKGQNEISNNVAVLHLMMGTKCFVYPNSFLFYL